MPEKNKVYELKNKRAYLLEDAEKHLNTGEMEKYKAKMEEVTSLNSEIEAQELLTVEQGRFENSDKDFVTQAAAQAQKKEEQALANKLDSIRSSNEYTRAFANALSMGVTVKSGRSIDSLSPLYNALTETGGDPAGSDGGFLVPIDIDNKIAEIMRSMTNLTDLVTVENVNTLSGWRAMEVGKAQQPFVLIDEMDPIPDAEKPSFKKISYSVKKYGGKIPVSNELISDEVANLIDYLARWMGRKSVLTSNSLILAIWNSLAAVNYDTTKGIQPLKTALNKELDPDISINSVLVTNQSGFDFLDNLEGTDGRPLLQPDPTEKTKYTAFGRKIEMVSNTLLPDRVDGLDSFAPLYIGSGKLFTTLFRRKAIEIASTNIGAGAFETDSTMIRGLMRLDTQKVDGDAMIKKEIPL